MGLDSWTSAYPTAAEALAHWTQTTARYADWHKRRPNGVLLGYTGRYQREFPLEDRDELVVLVDTVSVADGVVRGLVHNLSEKRFARNVVVTARPTGSTEADGGRLLNWRWPLTVQPGERAPFEIEGWEGSVDPANIAISVTADMSTAVDISRAFKLGEMRLKPRRGSDVLMVGLLTEPTSQPGLAELIQQQTIEDIRAYFAILDNDNEKVIELEQVSVSFDLWYDDGTYSRAQVIPIESFPVTIDDLPDDLASRADHTFFGSSR